MPTAGVGIGFRHWALCYDNGFQSFYAHSGRWNTLSGVDYAGFGTFQSFYAHSGRWNY